METFSSPAWATRDPVSQGEAEGKEEKEETEEEAEKEREV